MKIDEGLKTGEKVVLNVELENIDCYIKKANQYIALMKEAKSLAEELASIELEIKLT